MILGFEDLTFRSITAPLIIFFVSVIVAFITKKVSKKSFRHYTYTALGIESFLPKLIIFMGAILALSQLGIAISVLLLFIGFGGIALLVGLRFALENILSRLALDFNPSYKIGDWLHIKEFFGKVIEINALNTILLSEEGEAMTVPNSIFLKEITLNKSLTAIHEIMIPIAIPKAIDVVEFEKLLLEECNKMHRYLRRKPQPRIVTLKITDTEEELNLIAMLKDPEYKSVVLTQLGGRIKKIVDQLTIELKKKKKI